MITCAKRAFIGGTTACTYNGDNITMQELIMYVCVCHVSLSVDLECYPSSKSLGERRQEYM